MDYFCAGCGRTHISCAKNSSSLVGAQGMTLCDLCSEQEENKINELGTNDIPDMVIGYENNINNPPTEDEKDYDLMGRPRIGPY